MKASVIKLPRLHSLIRQASLLPSRKTRVFPTSLLARPSIFARHGTNSSKMSSADNQIELTITDEDF